MFLWSSVCVLLHTSSSKETNVFPQSDSAIGLHAQAVAKLALGQVCESARLLVLFVNVPLVATFAVCPLFLLHRLSFSPLTNLSDVSPSLSGVNAWEVSLPSSVPSPHHLSVE